MESEKVSVGKMPQLGLISVSMEMWFVPYQEPVSLKDRNSLSYYGYWVLCVKCKNGFKRTRYFMKSGIIVRISSLCSSVLIYLV